MVFRLQAIHISLTYPQCSIPKDEVFNHLLNLTVGQATVEKLLVSKELHEDGNPHLHAYLKWSRKPDIRDERFFDFAEQHPNIQACRAPKQWIKYCTKTDTEPACNFEWESLKPIEEALRILRQSNQGTTQVNDILDQALDMDPGLIRCYTQIRSYVYDRIKGSPLCMPEFPIETFALTAADYCRILGYKQAIAVHTPGDRTRLRSLWFVGTSRLGKTALARSIGKHFYIGGTWNVDKIQEGAEYGVIDDLPWEDLSFKDNYKKLLGLQKDFTLTDKYRHKKEFKLGIPMIVCTNELPSFKETERNWLMVNVQFYRIYHPIYPGCNPVPFVEINL